jgi:hypothetical protein
MLLRDDLLLALTRLDACDDARAWLTSCPACTFADLWDACPRGDWLLWLAGRLPGLEAQVGRATAAVAHLALAAIPDEHPGADELREIVRVGAEVAEAGGKSGALHDRAFMLFNYNDGNLEEAIGHVGLLLAELDPTSAYEVAWGVGDCLLDVTRGSIDEQRIKVLTHTADAARSVLGAEEVEEALASFLWSRPGAGVAA